MGRASRSRNRGVKVTPQPQRSGTTGWREHAATIAVADGAVCLAHYGIPGTGLRLPDVLFEAARAAVEASLQADDREANEARRHPRAGFVVPCEIAPDTECAEQPVAGTRESLQEWVVHQTLMLLDRVWDGFDGPHRVEMVRQGAEAFRIDDTAELDYMTHTAEGSFSQYLYAGMCITHRLNVIVGGSRCQSAFARLCAYVSHRADPHHARVPSMRGCNAQFATGARLRRLWVSTALCVARGFRDAALRVEIPLSGHTSVVIADAHARAHLTAIAPRWMREERMLVNHAWLAQFVATACGAAAACGTELVLPAPGSLPAYAILVETARTLDARKQALVRAAVGEAFGTNARFDAMPYDELVVWAVCHIIYVAHLDGCPAIRALPGVVPTLDRDDADFYSVDLHQDGAASVGALTTKLEAVRAAWRQILIEDLTASTPKRRARRPQRAKPEPPAPAPAPAPGPRIILQRDHPAYDAYEEPRMADAAPKRALTAVQRRARDAAAPGRARDAAPKARGRVCVYPEPEDVVDIALAVGTGWWHGVKMQAAWVERAAPGIGCS